MKKVPAWLYKKDCPPTLFKDQDEYDRQVKEGWSDRRVDLAKDDVDRIESPFASNQAEDYAREHKIDISGVKGTGKGDKITLGDLKKLNDSP